MDVFTCTVMLMRYLIFRQFWVNRLYGLRALYKPAMGQLPPWKKSFCVRGGCLKVTLLKRNTTHDFLYSRGRYLLPTSMDKQSFGARDRYLNLASTGNVLHMRYLLLAQNHMPIPEMPFFKTLLMNKRIPFRYLLLSNAKCHMHKWPDTNISFCGKLIYLLLA